MRHWCTTIFHQPSKRVSMGWEKASVQGVKVKKDRSVDKCTVAVFWDRKDVILTRYVPEDTTIYADTYCQVLQDLCLQSGINSPDYSANSFCYCMTMLVPIWQSKCKTSCGSQIPASPHTVRTSFPMITVCF